MNANEIRQKYLDFFHSRGHAVIKSASLIPENDPTVLFTTAGMHPLVPYLLGENHPAGNRLASVQKCIRTGDIDEVGDKTHGTFFEMLGNWSLGDYFKEGAIALSWEFLTSPKCLGLDKNKLAVSIFAGDADAPFDQESYDKWVSLGIKPERVAKLGKTDNWWGPAGQTGPCGPDTEMFYWTGMGEAPAHFDHEDKNWVEIWNDVFMSYNKNADGGFSELTQKNVDTGLGLERILMIVNKLDDIYKTDLYLPIITQLEKISGRIYQPNSKLFRIIADHLKAAVFIIGDTKGVVPSNTDQGYVVRRLIRRVIRAGVQLGIREGDWLSNLAQTVIGIYSEVYPELKTNQNFVKQNLKEEETKFSAALISGEKELSKNSVASLSGQAASNLYQSYGLPIEMIKEMAAEKNIRLEDDFDQVFENLKKQHQELSRTAAAGKFKGGLADGGEATAKLHTATHLLLAALRKVLGEHVLQRGSNITPERLRLDFSHNEKLTPEQLKEVEALVNQAIADNLPINCAELSLAEAKNQGAMGVFESKYDEKVKVYTVGPFSKEICGGPHASCTGELGRFKITKEEASSAGVRRIKAMLE